MDELTDLPVVTRSFAAACTVVTGLLTSRTVSLADLWIYYPFVFDTRRLELWRLVTNFCVIDTKFSLSWLLSMYMFIRNSKYIETTRFHNNTLGYAKLWLGIIVSLLAINAGLFYLGLPFSSFASFFQGPSLIYALQSIHLYQNPGVAFVLMGFIVVPAPYLPLAIIALALINGEKPIHFVQGWIIGHTYTYFADVLPKLFEDEKPPQQQPQQQEQQQEGEGEEEEQQQQPQDSTEEGNEAAAEDERGAEHALAAEHQPQLRQRHAQQQDDD